MFHRGIFQLREVALQYYDCSENPQIQNLVEMLSESRAQAALKAYERREHCVNVLENEKARRTQLGGKSIYKFKVQKTNVKVIFQF